MLKTKYVIVLHVHFNGKDRDWIGYMYDSYPTGEEIKSCMEDLRDRYRNNIEFSHLYYASVEKRYYE